MVLRFASATALALIATVSVSAAHADTGYQPYYDTRDSVMYSDVQTPQSSPGTPAVPVVSNPGQAAPWQAPRETVADGGVFGVPQDWNNEPALFHYNNALWASAGTSFMNIKSDGVRPSSIRGWQPSLEAGASYMNHYNTYFALSGFDDFGDASYRYETAAAPTVPVQSSSSATTYEVDGKIGQGFYAGPQVMLIPYADVGYRHLKFDAPTAAQSPIYHNFSIMGGLMAEVNPIPRLFLTGYGAGGTTLGGRTIDGNGISSNTGDSGIYDVGGKAGFMMTPRVELFSTLDYLHFHYGQSSVSSTGTSVGDRQDNDTTVRVGLGYHFR